MTIEQRRLIEAKGGRVDWRRWGAYLSERSWGTVREDYSVEGSGFTFHDALSHVYRWSEDGIGGFCDITQNVCLSLMLWNERDPFLKERFFGVEGNIKESYQYLDGLPTQSYMKMLYRYPQAAFPYDHLNAQTSLEETGVFNDNRYFEVVIEYAKADYEDVLCRITVTNLGVEDAPVHILPQIWFRNSWTWGYDSTQPHITRCADNGVCLEQRELGNRWWYATADDINPALFFCDNDTHSKDAIHAGIVSRDLSRLNNDGTRCAAHFHKTLAPSEIWTIRVRFSNIPHTAPFDNFDAIFIQRLREAEEFYGAVQPAGLSPETKDLQRQAFGALMWSKQFYHFNVRRWLKGDPGYLAPQTRSQNESWQHLNAEDVFTVADKWKYPYFSAWDVALQVTAVALVDVDFAKRQLVRLLQPHFLNANGQIPNSEIDFNKAHPPIYAWACLRVYQIEKQQIGHGDLDFLQTCFDKLRRNFEWWQRYKDPDRDSLFYGGALGMPGISAIDRSALPSVGACLKQADATGWMALYSLQMMAMALELAHVYPNYEKNAVRFLERFIDIANACYDLDTHGISLWDEDDGFFYDVLRADGKTIPLKVQSYVGLIPLLAIHAVPADLLERFNRFRQRIEWFLQKRPHLINRLFPMTDPGKDKTYRLALVNPVRLRRILEHVLNPAEFLSESGVRSLSKYHQDNPFKFKLNGKEYKASYEPGDDWCGAVHPSINRLVIEAIQSYGLYLGNTFKVDLFGRAVPLSQVADYLTYRLVNATVREGQFYECVHGDSGAGMGAKQHHGWAAAVAALLHQTGQF